MSTNTVGSTDRCFESTQTNASRRANNFSSFVRSVTPIDIRYRVQVAPHRCPNPLSSTTKLTVCIAFIERYVIFVMLVLLVVCIYYPAARERGVMPWCVARVAWHRVEYPSIHNLSIVTSFEWNTTIIIFIGLTI